MGDFENKQEYSFEAVYDAYYDRIYKYAFMLLMNQADAEDVTSQTFLAAFMSFDRYDPEKASLRTWLTRIAHNRAVNLRRSAAYRKRADTPGEWKYADENSDFSEHVENSELVLMLYSHLEPAERELLNMRYVMGLRDREIGALLQINEKAANKRIKRLLTKCRIIMSPNG